MNEEEQSFREKYKFDANTQDTEGIVNDPRRQSSVASFKELIKRSVNDEISDIWLKAMAIINLEMERKFEKSNIHFDAPMQYSQSESNTFALIARKKSKRSTKKKRKDNIREFDKQFEEAIETGNENAIPQNVKHIYDLYGFKLICPNIENSQSIVFTVVNDILNDIEEHSPERVEETQPLKQELNNKSLVSAVDFITNNFSDKYPGLKNRILKITTEQKQANDIQDFLDSTSDNVSNLTYAEYYGLIIKCQQALLDLSYKETNPSIEPEDEKGDYDERDYIMQNINKIQQKIDALTHNGKANQLIDKTELEAFSSALSGQLNMVSKKRTNKLDLSVGDLMFFDVITTSKALKKAGIMWSDDVTRNKLKRNKNGYIANFYSLDGPNGIHAEMQVQSLYRYHFGEIGPAAHNKMPGKKRVLYSPKKSHKKKWFRKLTNSIPRRSFCMGNGEIKVNNIQEDFYEQYKPKTNFQLEVYRRFMMKQFKNIYKFINAYRGNILKYQFNDDFSEVIKIGEQELTPDYIEDASPFSNSIEDVLEL